MEVDGVDTKERRRTRSMDNSNSSSMSSTFQSPNINGDTILCDCGLKARISVAKTRTNHGRKFFGCPRYNKEDGCNFFRWVQCGDGQERGMRDVIEELRRKELMISSMVEEGRAELQSLKEENSLLRRIVLEKPREQGNLVDDSDSLNRMKAYEKEEIARLRKLVMLYKYMLYVTWVGILLYWVVFSR